MASTDKRTLIVGESARGPSAALVLYNKDVRIEVYVPTVYENGQVNKIEDVRPQEKSKTVLDKPFDVVNITYPIESPILLEKLKKRTFDATGSHTILILDTSTPSELEPPTTPEEPLKMTNPEEPGTAGKEVEKKKEASPDALDSASWMVFADSDRIVYILWRVEGAWTIYTSFQTKLRIMKLAIEPKGRHLIITEKRGDIYVSKFETRDGASKFKRILGHCGLILDTIVANGSRVGGDLIFTADRDHKIRCSRFPEGHEIEFFLLGHTAPVLSIAFLNEEKHLISVAEDGQVKLWNIADQKCFMTWKICQDESFIKHIGADSVVVTGMKISELQSGVRCAFSILNQTGIFVFELSPDLKTFKYIGSTGPIPTALFWWHGMHLYHWNAVSPIPLEKRADPEDLGSLRDSLNGRSLEADVFGRIGYARAIAYFNSSEPD